MVGELEGLARGALECGPDGCFQSLEVIAAFEEEDGSACRDQWNQPGRDGAVILRSEVESCKGIVGVGVIASTHQQPCRPEALK